LHGFSTTCIGVCHTYGYPSLFRIISYFMYYEKGKKNEKIEKKKKK